MFSKLERVLLALLIINTKKSNIMSELELVQAVVAKVVELLAAGHSNPVVTASEDCTKLVLSTTPSVVTPVVTEFPVTNVLEAA